MVEFGLVGATMHQVDERVATADLVALTAIYRRILDRISAEIAGALHLPGGGSAQHRAKRDASRGGVKIRSSRSPHPARFARDPPLQGRVSRFAATFRSILHPHQIQPIRRRDRAAGGAVARGERARRDRRRAICRRRPAPASRPSSAPGGAGTSAPRRCTCTSSPARVDVEPVERLDRRLGLAFGGAEGGEVVLADQPLRRRVHGVDIERARHAPGAVAIERQIGAAVDDAVEIVPLASRRSARRNVSGTRLGRRARRPDAGADAR